MLFTGSFFFISYLLGNVIRLYAPEKADNRSTWYLKRLGKKELWTSEEFPYQKSIDSRFRNSGLGQVIIWIIWPFGILIPLGGAVLYSIKGLTVYALSYVTFFAINLFILVPLLARFKYMRRKEVMTVWNSYYIVAEGYESGKVH